MRPGSRALAGVLLCTALLQGACSDDPNGPGNDGEAQVTIRLTDAPGDVLAAVVTIDEIYLQGGAGGRTVLSDEPFTTDLLTLANTSTVIVNGADVEAGTYSELRFVISGGYVEVEDQAGGSEFFASSPTYAGLPAGVLPDGELVMPSLGQSGLKVEFDGALVLDGDHDFLVDFDVAQSFGHEAGNSGRWIMTPVIRGGETTEAGTIRVRLELGTGVTLPLLNGVAVALTDFKADLDGQAKAIAAASAGGFEAVFPFRLAGSYDVTIQPPAGLSIVTQPAGPVAVNLAAGGEEVVTFTITAATVLPGG